MSDLKLGQIITDEQYRDAIHIAVAPVEALEDLEPGQHVGVTGSIPQAAKQSPYVGIVDPFLKTDVKRGEKFWLYLYPGSITSLRHEWTHRAFGAVEISVPLIEKAASRKWIEECASDLDVSAESLIDAATRFIETGDYWYGEKRTDDDGHGYTSFSGGETLPDEFWEHYEVVTGNRVPSRERESFFSCSC